MSPNTPAAAGGGRIADDPDLADTSEDATLDGNLDDGTAIEGLDSVNIVKDCS